jgi:hypothetical protein
MDMKRSSLGAEAVWEEGNPFFGVMELLDGAEEKRIRNQLRDEAAAKCSDEKALFGQCVASAKISTVLWCRGQMSNWNNCLKSQCAPLSPPWAILSLTHLLSNTEEEIEKRLALAIQQKSQKYNEHR